jgi:hypothetical protein
MHPNKRTTAAKLLFSITIALTSGCASTIHSIDQKQISETDTAIIGELSIERFKFKSSYIETHQIPSPDRISIGIKKVSQDYKVPFLNIYYGDVIRVHPDATGKIVAKLDPGRYIIADIVVKAPGLNVTSDNFLMVSLSNQEGTYNTIEFNIKANATNNIGKITIIESRESYIDKNNDSKISRDEFDSRIATFEDISKGEPSFSADMRWTSIKFKINHTQTTPRPSNTIDNFATILKIR